MKKLCCLYDQAIGVTLKLNWLPPLLARISIGSIFIIAGWGKIHNIQKVIGYFTDLGIPLPELHANLVAYTELTCGSLIIIGLLTRLVSIPLMITMIVAILTAKRSEIGGATDLLGLDEFIYIIFFIWLIIGGAGKISVDALLRKVMSVNGHHCLEKS